MGGFHVPTQAFGTYQAIDWLRETATIDQQVNACRRIRLLAEEDKSDVVIKLNLVSRINELLETTQVEEVQVNTYFRLGKLPHSFTKFLKE